MTCIWCHCGLAALLMSSEEFIPHGHIDQFQNGRHNLRIVGSLQQKLHRKSRALPKTTCPVTAGSSGLSAIVKQMGQRTWRRHRDSDITHMWCASHDVKKSNTFKWWASDGQGQFQAQWQDLVVSCLQQKSAAWKMALQPPKHSPEVVKGQQIVWYQMFVRTWRNYTETIQKLCRDRSESRTAFLKWDSVMPARLSMSISANRGSWFRSFAWNQNETNQVTKPRPLQHSSLRSSLQQQHGRREVKGRLSWSMDLECQAV